MFLSLFKFFPAFLCDLLCTYRTSPYRPTALNVRPVSFFSWFVVFNFTLFLFINAFFRQLQTRSRGNNFADWSCSKNSWIRWTPLLARITGDFVNIPRGVLFPFPALSNFSRGSSPGRSVGRSFPPPPPPVELPLWNSIDWSYNVVSYVLGRTNRIQSPGDCSHWGFTI